MTPTCSAKLSNHFLLCSFKYTDRTSVQMVIIQRTSRICVGTSRRCDAHWKFNQMVSNALVNNYDGCDSLVKTGGGKKASDLFLVKRRLCSTFNLQPETYHQPHMGLTFYSHKYADSLIIIFLDTSVRNAYLSDCTLCHVCQTQS